MGAVLAEWILEVGAELATLVTASKKHAPITSRGVLAWTGQVAGYANPFDVVLRNLVF